MRHLRSFLYCFKFLCLVTAGSMSGYWIYKYWKDDDITVIEYKAFKDSEAMNLPAMSICFSNPFMINKGSLENNTTLKVENYLKFLRGEDGFNQNYETVLFENDTIDILDYLDNIIMYQRLNKKQTTHHHMTCTNPKSCNFASFRNNFNAFFHSTFLKCFEMKVKKEFSMSIRFMILGFKRAFENVVRGSRGISIHFRYPGQLLTDLQADEFLWKNANDTESFMMFKLASTEILRRRSKRNRECISDSMSYDDLKLKEMVKNVGCRAIYHNLHYDIPICNRTEELVKFDAIDIEDVKIPRPCEEFPQVSFKLIRIWVGDMYGYYPLQIQFPKKMKLITQQQAIDIHALIGNIGGYIGLFLGEHAM